METQNKPVTQKHIAQKLGVSHQLVGLALSGHAAVSDQTRQKIIDTAQELGYNRFSNREARTLIARRYGKRVRTGVTAVIVPKMDGGTLRGSPYYPAILDGIETEADRLDQDVLICINKSSGLPRLVQAGEVDGVICLGGFQETLDSISALGIPVVNLDRIHSGCHCLTPDNHLGMLLAVRHLIELGHTRIAYLGLAPEDQAPLARYRGYCDALAEAGIPHTEELVAATLKSVYAPGGMEGMASLLGRTRDFTAVACYNDTQAFGAVKMARERGLRIPEDLSITGFDDLSSDFQFDPFVTSVRFSRRHMGQRAVQLVMNECDLNYADPDRVPQYTHEIVPVELAIRHSTGAPHPEPDHH